jgi:O-methyltransferase involved in polyketide biosynthesis
LADAGFRSDCPAFFQWLGVVVYLSLEAILATLRVIASIPASAVVFEYTEPFKNHSPEGRARLMIAAKRAAERGEPWLSFFNPAELSTTLRGNGFADVEDLRATELIKRYHGAPGTNLNISPGGHLVRAERTL